MGMKKPRRETRLFKGASGPSLRRAFGLDLRPVRYSVTCLRPSLAVYSVVVSLSASCIDIVDDLAKAKSSVPAIAAVLGRVMSVELPHERQQHRVIILW